MTDNLVMDDVDNSALNNMSLRENFDQKTQIVET